jgi:hypothetical protein
MTPTRRDFLKSSGALVVGFSALSMAPAETFVVDAGQAPAAGPYPDLDFHQLDSWIVIREDNTATFHVGKTDLGQGTGTAFRQIMSDDSVSLRPGERRDGRTDVTVDQGGSGGSDSLQTDGWPMRRVTAEARRVLLELAATRFSVPVSALVVSKGVVSLAADPSRKVTYGELIGGKRFNVTLTGNNIDATTGQAKLKTVQQLEMVGQSPQRFDIPPKVDGSLKWAVDVKLPGMLHARNIKPPVAGATLVSIDESSVKSIPGFVKVVSKGNYVAVVCEREEQAIRAARALKVDWRKPATPPFPSSDELFTYMRGRSLLERQAYRPGQRMRRSRRQGGRGAIRRAVPGPHVDWPGARDGRPVERSAHDLLNDMKSYGLRRRRAVLKMPREKVRVVWMAAGVRANRGAMRGSRRRFGEGARQARARAVDAAGGDGLGYEGAGVRLHDARRARCAGESHRARVRRSCSGSQPSRLQRARHRTDRAAHRHAARRTSARPGVHSVGDVRHPESPVDDRGRAAAARLGDADSHRQLARS